MKIAVSIPDDLFERAEQVAARRGWNRSQLYTRALDSFIADDPVDDPVTEQLDRLAGELGTSALHNAGRALIDAEQWEW